MPYCHQFKTQIAQWEKELSEARVLLGGYLESGEEEKVGKVRERLKKVTQTQKEFLESDFKKQVIKILKKWSPGNKEEIKDFFIQQIKFRDRRVVMEDFIPLEGSSITYFPSIIEEVSGNLEIHNTRIKTLDFLERVGGRCRIIGTPLESLRKLKIVNDDFLLVDTRVQTLDSLELVEGTFFIKCVPFKSAPKLYKIGVLKGSLTILRGRLQNDSLPLSEGPLLVSFNKTFPHLKEIGEDHNGISIIVSVGATSSYLRGEIDQLQQAGKLKVKGKIKIS